MPPPRRVSRGRRSVIRRNTIANIHHLLASSGPVSQKKNPLKNKAVLFRLNPYAKTLRRQELIRSEKKGAVKKSIPASKAAGEEFLKTLHAA